MPETRLQRRMRESKSAMKENTIPIPQVLANSPKYSSITTSLKDDAFSCPICLEPFIKPMVLGCGHDFCKYCIDKWTGNKVRPECPVCRTEIQKISTSISLSKIMDEFYHSSADVKSSYEARVKQREGAVSIAGSRVPARRSVSQKLLHAPASPSARIGHLVLGTVRPSGTSLSRIGLGHLVPATVRAPAPPSARIGHLVPATVRAPAPPSTGIAHVGLATIRAPAPRSARNGHLVPSTVRAPAPPSARIGHLVTPTFRAPTPPSARIGNLGPATFRAPPPASIGHLVPATVRAPPPASIGHLVPATVRAPAPLSASIRRLGPATVRAPSRFANGAPTSSRSAVNSISAQVEKFAETYPLLTASLIGIVLVGFINCILKKTK